MRDAILLLLAQTWTMEVHTPSGTERFAIAEIDSITFSPAPAIDMVGIPAGSFTMGDGAAVCGTDEREVALTQPFLLGRREVTNQEYLDAVQWAYDQGRVTATPLTVVDAVDGSTVELVDLNDLECEIAFANGTFVLRDAGHGLNPDHPMKEVTWWGAAAFCDWLSEREGLPRAYDHATWECNGGDPYGATGYRLPTDAEWEYAAQWDDERIYPWGNAPPDSTLANYDNVVGWTTPAGSYPGAPSVGGEALFDLAGNLAELCNDWYSCALGTLPATDPTGPPAGTARVLRGGDWAGDGLRAADRLPGFPANAHDKIGFRCARSQ
jgi:formylglycine-generating enzyme required for sulfatase activity